MKQPITIALVVLCAILLITPMFTLAQEKPASTPPANKPVFLKHDANVDGKITHDEFSARRKAWFQEIDVNGDGKVTQQEWAAFHVSSFQKMDGADKDGMATLDEFIIFFAGPDAKVEKAEREAIAKAAKPGETKCDFEKMDTNADGTLAFGEFVVAWEGSFKEADTNQDGKLSKDEYMAYRNKEFTKKDKDKDSVMTMEEMVPPETR